MSDAHEVDAAWAARRSIHRCGDDDEEFVTTRGKYVDQKRRSFERGAAWQAEQDHRDEPKIAKVAAQRSARISELEAEVAFYTKPLECKIVHEQPYDFKQCETHDRTFPLDGDCDYRGLSLIEYDEQKHHEQRGRAVRAEMRAEAAEAEVARLRAATDLAKTTAAAGMDARTFVDSLGTLLDHDPVVQRAETAEAKLAAALNHIDKKAFEIDEDWGSADVVYAADMKRILEGEQ